MRTLMRAGAIALAASSVVLGGAVAAQAAPVGTVTVAVNRLILEPAEYGHTGSIRIVVRNGTSEPFSGGITITEPMPYTFVQTEGASGCGHNTTPDNRTIAMCGLDKVIKPGRSTVVTVQFRSPAKPQAYAQIAPLNGSVEVDGVTAEFPALFRSTTGSLRNPSPYVADTTQALSVAAGDVTLTRQEDGTFAGRVPVTVRNNSDAPHRDLFTELATPAGIDSLSRIEPSEVCFGGDQLPIPPGGNSVSCTLYGGQLAEGQERAFEWVLTAPAETPAGPIGTATTLVEVAGDVVAQTDGANLATFNITVAG
ncbi:hypothetical protein [Actinoplanes aureus]|uniref:DUF11 domain-containing protein n=1 Tax=Actinoplanes aureus TaxID=2792083 RepID=A0A931C4B8_9ACTN|nr:hypothetical protein [Actinoplanes aureus]MBG0560826.1 hypothetical protein [Actinoplanes aureus]